MGGDQVALFISYAGSDRPWAEWVAWQLAEAGYHPVYDRWGWAAGQNFITQMNEALEQSERVVALFSAAYFDPSRYTTHEWSASLVTGTGKPGHRLVPLWVEEVPAAKVPALLRPLVTRKLFGVGEEEARRVLLEAVAGPRPPERGPDFPGTAVLGKLAGKDGAGPRLPGTEPSVWQVPARNPAFTGRDGLLVTIREQLLAGDRAVVQALHGMGGVGKTQLALEYAHRFASGYDVAWWLAAEEPGLLAEQLAALAAELGHPPTGTGTDAVLRAVQAGLRAHGRWLLVFDNAENPGEVAGWLPSRGGHVLITSRAPGWTELAVPVEVDVLTRAESVAILHGRVAGLTAADADGLADALGDLPLALAQAAAYLAGSGMSADAYRRLLATRAAHILSQGKPVSYPRSLAAAAQLSLDRLGREDEAALELVNVCAFLGPELIPREMFTQVAGKLPASLASQVADPLAWAELLARIGRYAIARIDQHGLQFHRLTQAIARDRLDPAGAAAKRALAEEVLASSQPAGTDDPATWRTWASLMPHLLAADLAAATSPAVRIMACNATRYLRVRGSIRGSYDLADSLRRNWRARLGDDHEHTMEATSSLAAALWHMGRCAAARDLDEETLERRRRVLGDDAPDTLRAANDLASDLYALGDLEAARELFEDTLARRRRVLGGDHPDTLASANNLAAELQQLNDARAAADLFEDTLARRRRVLGDDHPDTLRSASNLSIVLQELGEPRKARDLGQDTLDRRRRVLGDDHPDSLRSASNLASAHYKLGEAEAARDLDQDTLDRRRRLLGDDHPDTLDSASNLASDLRKLGELVAARDLERDTLARRRRTLGDDHPGTVRSFRLLDADEQALSERGR